MDFNTWFMKTYHGKLGIDIIEASFREVAEKAYYEALPKWTPVTERLPKAKVKVLTYSPELDSPYRILETNNGRFYGDVLYWQPLTKPKIVSYPYNAVKPTINRQGRKKESCDNCLNRDGGTCTEVPGQNYGKTSEVSPNFVCANWKESKGINDASGICRDPTGKTTLL
jgi:hypothetical protein